MVINTIFVMFEMDIRIVEVANLNKTVQITVVILEMIEDTLEVEMLKEIHSHLII